jgi:hypothetical protein
MGSLKDVSWEEVEVVAKLEMSIVWTMILEEEDTELEVLLMKILQFPLAQNTEVEIMFISIRLEKGVSKVVISLITSVDMNKSMRGSVSLAGLFREVTKSNATKQLFLVVQIFTFINLKALLELVQ